MEIKILLIASLVSTFSLAVIFLFLPDYPKGIFAKSVALIIFTMCAVSLLIIPVSAVMAIWNY